MELATASSQCPGPAPLSRVAHPWRVPWASGTASVLSMMERLAARTGNPYGKAPGDTDRILRDLAEIQPLLRNAAHHEIRTTIQLADVEAEVLQLAGVFRQATTLPAHAQAEHQARLRIGAISAIMAPCPVCRSKMCLSTPMPSCDSARPLRISLCRSTCGPDSSRKPASPRSMRCSTGQEAALVVPCH